jgi:hypothetical protein
MVKMVGSYTRPEELLTKLANENSYLKKQIKELKEENSRLTQIIEDQEIELQYARYYADEENYKESIELANLQSDDIVTYEEWFNSELSDKLIETYAKYYN